MSMLRFAVVVVEGHWEVEALPILLRRLFQHYWPNIGLEVLRPIRQPRERLVRNIENSLTNSLKLAVTKLRQLEQNAVSNAILVLCDADDDCAIEVAGRMRDVTSQWVAGHKIQISVVVAVRTYETWFAGAAESLGRFLDLSTPIPSNPEAAGCRKSWIESGLKGVKYSEAVDQPKMTAAFDIDLCRKRCSSFDKLVREVEKAVVSTPDSGQDKD